MRKGDGKGRSILNINAGKSVRPYFDPPGRFWYSLFETRTYEDCRVRNHAPPHRRLTGPISRTIARTTSPHRPRPQEHDGAARHQGIASRTERQRERTEIG